MLNRRLRATQTARPSKMALVAVSYTHLSAVTIASAQKKSIPVGLEMYSVRRALMTDLMGTVRKVAEIGYQDMEFYAPYYQWSADQAKEVRKLLDDTGTRCLSTHRCV